MWDGWLCIASSHPVVRDEVTAPLIFEVTHTALCIRLRIHLLRGVDLVIVVILAVWLESSDFCGLRTKRNCEKWFPTLLAFVGCRTVVDAAHQLVP